VIITIVRRRYAWDAGHLSASPVRAGELATAAPVGFVSIEFWSFYNVSSTETAPESMAFSEAFAI